MRKEGLTLTERRAMKDIPKRSAAFPYVYDGVSGQLILKRSLIVAMCAARGLCMYAHIKKKKNRTVSEGYITEQNIMCCLEESVVCFEVDFDVVQTVTYVFCLPRVFVVAEGFPRIFVDAPCGDLNWMRFVIDECPTIDYIGGDIVKPMIDTNTERYGRPGVRFIELDITSDMLPSVDLMICRDCLFHLPEEEIFKFIDNFINSDIKYLLTTSYYDDGSVSANTAIHPGNWFDLNLLSTPYNFPKDALYRIDDWILTDNVRYMYLWDRDQIISARNITNK